MLDAQGLGTGLLPRKLYEVSIRFAIRRGGADGAPDNDSSSGEEDAADDLLVDDAGEGEVYILQLVWRREWISDR